MATRNLEFEEDIPFSEEDYDRAQARLDALIDPLAGAPDSDARLYRSIEAVVLGDEPRGVKESMVICMLEKLFLRFKSGFGN